MAAKIICSSSLCFYHNRNSCTLSEIKIGFPIPKCTSFRLSKERLEALSPTEAMDTKQGKDIEFDNQAHRHAFSKQDFS